MTEISTRSPVRQRPLSPHLQIYRFIPTMLMSILHRATGIGLYLGWPVVIFWIFIAAFYPDLLEFMQKFLTSPVGLVLLTLLLWGMMHHMLGGLRYFIWDLGYGLGEKARHALALGTAALALLITLLVWVATFCYTKFPS